MFLSHFQYSSILCVMRIQIHVESVIGFFQFSSASLEWKENCRKKNDCTITQITRYIMPAKFLYGNPIMMVDEAINLFANAYVRSTVSPTMESKSVH